MNGSEGRTAIDRRALLRGAMLLVGASAAGIPGELLAQTASAKRFFAPANFAVLDEVAEIMIPRTDTPGARDAGVPVAFDAMMTNWASAERRRQFTALLEEIDKAGAAAGGRGLLSLAPAARIEAVRRFDADKLAANDTVYRRFKELVLTLYYLSEPGATQELRYELVPGKWDGFTTIGPDTRAWAV